MFNTMFITMHLCLLTTLRLQIIVMKLPEYTNTHHTSRQRIHDSSDIIRLNPPGGSTLHWGAGRVLLLLLSVVVVVMVVVIVVKQVMHVAVSDTHRRLSIELVMPSL